MSLSSPALNMMQRAAEKAARTLVRDFGEVEQLQVSRKGPSDFVSAADRRAEEILVAELQKTRPGFGFLLEEGGEIKGSDGEHRFIIDPLDGTTNFLHGVPHWCISIALERRDEIIAALVFDPVKDEVFHAEKGAGAFMRRRRLRVSGRRDLSMALIAGGDMCARRQDFDLFMKMLRNVVEKTAGFRRTGSAALDLAYVAGGRFDGFWERGLKPWDTAAGILLIREAGGFVIDLDGSGNPVYGLTLMASNVGLHEPLKELLSLSP